MLKYKKRVFLKENILSLDILLNYIVRFYRNLLLGTLYAKECYVRSFFFFFSKVADIFGLDFINISRN